MTSGDSTVILTPPGYPFNATAPYALNFTHLPTIDDALGYGGIQIIIYLFVIIYSKL